MGAKVALGVLLPSFPTPGPPPKQIFFWGGGGGEPLAFMNGPIDGKFVASCLKNNIPPQSFWVNRKGTATLETQQGMGIGPH